MIRGHRHLLHSLCHDAIADGDLLIEERLRLGVLIGAVEQDDVLHLLMILEEGEKSAGIDVPPVLVLRVEDVCPVDEDERLAFECEERNGHVCGIVPHATVIPESIAVLIASSLELHSPVD